MPNGYCNPTALILTLHSVEVHSCGKWLLTGAFGSKSTNAAVRTAVPLTLLQYFVDAPWLGALLEVGLRELRAM